MTEDDVWGECGEMGFVGESDVKIGGVLFLVPKKTNELLFSKKNDKTRSDKF